MMSFEKQYPNRKDHRKPYLGAMAVDDTCKRISAANGDDGQAGLGLRRPEAFYTLAEIEPSPDGRNRTAERVLM